jgi:hypothetical protein
VRAKSTSRANIARKEMLPARRPTSRPPPPVSGSSISNQKECCAISTALGGERSPRAGLGGLPARGPHHVDGRKFNFFSFLV